MSVIDNSAGPYPTFNGLPGPPSQAPISAQTTGQRPLASNNTGSSLPPLTAAYRTKFTRIFVGCGPHNGLVAGDKARDVFVKSQLSYDKLGLIWYVPEWDAYRHRTDKQEPCRHPAARLTRSTRLHHRHVPHPNLHGQPKCPTPRYSAPRNVRTSLRRKGPSKCAIEPYCPTKHWATKPRPTSIHWRNYPTSAYWSRISATSAKVSFSPRNYVELAIWTGWIRLHLQHHGLGILTEPREPTMGRHIGGKGDFGPILRPARPAEPRNNRRRRGCTIHATKSAR